MATTTQQDIDALNAAIRRGEHSVTFNGRSVTYRSISDLIKARDDAAAQLAQETRPRQRSYHYQFKTLRGD